MKVITNQLVTKQGSQNTENKSASKLSVRELKRDKYSMIGAILPFIAVIIWLGLVLINGLFLEQSRLQWQTTVNTKKSQIETTYKQTLLTHGELVTKTNLLSGVIDKDIQPEEVFTLVEKLFPENPGFTVTGFGRENDGSFSVTINTYSYLQFSKIARRFNLYDKVSNVQVRNVGMTKSNLISGSINFFFVSSQLNAGKSTTTK